MAAFTIIPAAYENSRLDLAAKRKWINARIREAKADYEWLVDVDSLPELSDPTNLEYFLPDGVHLTEAAGRKIADYLVEVIKP